MDESVVNVLFFVVLYLVFDIFLLVFGIFIVLLDDINKVLE